MTAEITIYRCYWPKVYEYLKVFKIDNYKTEAFGLLMTIDIEPKQAQRIANLLPIGATVDLVHLDDFNLFSSIEIDALDVDNNSLEPVKTLKN